MNPWTIVYWDNLGVRKVSEERKITEAECLSWAKGFRTMDNRTVKCCQSGQSWHHWQRIQHSRKKNHWIARQVETEYLH